MRVYVAGPMTGLPEFNFPAFDTAAAHLRSEGHDVINPADLDREIGFDPSEATTVPQGFLREAMRRDLHAVCDCDAIALLPGWQKSRGAMIEFLLASMIGLDILFLNEAPAS